MKKAIAKAMKEYEEYTVQINELLKKQAACKEMLREEVLNYGQLKYKGITCSCVTRTTINYDIPAICKKLPQKLYSRFIDDKISFNTREFVQLLKKYNIEPKNFMKSNADKYERVKSVDETKLSKLYETGEVDVEALQGLYKAKESKTVMIRLPK